MVERAFLIAALSVSMVLLSPGSSQAQTSTLTVLDNSPFPGGPGDVDFVPGQNEIITMSFTTGEIFVHRLNPDGTVTAVGRIPAGPEPRAVAFAHGGELAVIANSIANELGVFEVGDKTLEPGVVALHDYSGNDPPGRVALEEQIVSTVKCFLGGACRVRGNHETDHQVCGVAVVFQPLGSEVRLHEHDTLVGEAAEVCEVGTRAAELSGKAALEGAELILDVHEASKNLEIPRIGLVQCIRHALEHSAPGN